MSSSTRPRFVFVRPGVKRTAFGEEPDRTIVVVVGAYPATIVVSGSSPNAVRLTPGRTKTNVPAGASNC